jgi:hypothetical protein
MMKNSKSKILLFVFFFFYAVSFSQSFSRMSKQIKSQYKEIYGQGKLRKEYRNIQYNLRNLAHQTFPQEVLKLKSDTLFLIEATSFGEGWSSKVSFFTDSIYFSYYSSSKKEISITNDKYYNKEFLNLVRNWDTAAIQKDSDGKDWKMSKRLSCYIYRIIRKKRKYKIDIFSFPLYPKVFEVNKKIYNDATQLCLRF